MLVIAALVLCLVYGQFRGNFTPKTMLTMVAPRAGLVMDPGSKVTYNGVEIGRVASIAETEHATASRRRSSPWTSTRSTSHLIPQNVDAKIKATTVFGDKYVSLTAPKDANGNSSGSQPVHRD